MKKILIFSQYFWPENFLINDLCLNIKSKFELKVFTGKPNYPKGQFYEGYGFFNKKKDFYNKIQIYRTFIIPRYSSTKFYIFVNYLSFIFSSFINLTFFFLNNKEYKICFAYATSPLISLLSLVILKKIFKIKLVIWLQDLWPLVFRKHTKSYFLKKIIFLLCSFIYKNSDFVLIQNNYFKKYLIETMGINKDKIDTLYNWSPIESPFSYKIKKKINNKLIFTGNIGEAQNFDKLMEAFQDNSFDTVLHIYGDGRFKKKLENIILQKKIEKVKIFDPINIDDLIPILKEYDGGLISLNSEYKHTIPSKFQFYMSNSLPIIGFIEGEVENLIIDYQLGYTAKPDHPKKLIEIIKKFEDLPYESKFTMSKNSYNLYMKKFSKESAINKFNKIMNI